MADDPNTATDRPRRVDPFSTADDALKALAVFGGGGRARTLDAELVVLAKMRVAQINSSAYGIEMAQREAARLNAPETRFDLLPQWRMRSEFSEREKAALAWTEAVTQFAATRVPDDVYNNAHAHFPSDELVGLTVAVVSANAWCQIAVSFRLAPQTE